MIRKVLYSFIVICVCIMHINANAADCPTGTETEPITQAACQAVSGCVYQVVNNVPLCAPCIDLGWYRDTTKTPYQCVECTKRPDGAGWTGNGGDSDNCPWEITCPENSQWDRTTSTCETCQGEETAKSVVVSFDGTNFTFTVDGTARTNPPECMKLSIPCANNVNDSLCADTPTGSANLDTSTGNYDYSTCSCHQDITDASGRISKECKFDKEGTSLVSDTCTIKSILCNNGYCTQDGKTCTLAPTGMFGPKENSRCGQCPAGSTSKPGSAYMTNCYYQPETIFKDSDGRQFKLPIPSAQKMYVFPF